MSKALSNNRILPALAHRFAPTGGLAAPAARAMTRVAVLVAIAISAAGCGRDKPEAAAGQTLSAEEVKQKCADQQWREKNLGIWYAVCRQPVAW